MILFDLECRGAGHRFEAWFGSSADYADQQQRGLLQCPLCDDRDVVKAVMAPAVPAKGNRRPSDPPDPQILALKARICAECDDVGRRFAEEARARHEAGERGETVRGCFGEATLSEAAGLLAEGVPLAPLPFRPGRLGDA